MIFRSAVIMLSLIMLWQLIKTLFDIPAYLLPSPWQVMMAFLNYADVLARESVYTLAETLIGLFLAILCAVLMALLMTALRWVRWWFMPILISSQAIPVFAIAPLLVLWLGYGMSSKIATTVLMLFFPITSALCDGLRQTPKAWLELAQTMNANRWQILWHIRVPAALPAFATGLRVASVIAPIGAIIGEWVGSSHGLGYLMLNANARLEIALMFAALLIVVVFALLLYFLVDAFLKRWIHWSNNTTVW